MCKGTWNTFSIHFTFLGLFMTSPHFFRHHGHIPVLTQPRYACDSDAANLLKTNANLTQILTTDLGLTVA